MEIVKFVIIGIICTVMTVVVRQYRPELAVAVQLAGIVIIAIYAFEYLKNIFEEIGSLFSDVQIVSDGYLAILIKILSIAVITKLGADICSDSSNSALATVVELTGKTVILVMCLSLIKTLVTLAKGLLE